MRRVRDASPPPAVGERAQQQNPLNFSCDLTRDIKKMERIPLGLRGARAWLTVRIASQLGNAPVAAAYGDRVVGR